MQNQTAWGNENTLDTHRVLQNTYRLLALTMLPTVLGAGLGIFLNLPVFLVTFIMESANSGNGATFLLWALLFLVSFLAFFVVIRICKNSVWGIVALLGLTFYMGLFLSVSLQAALDFTNGAELIALAGGGTATIFFVMSAIGSNPNRDLSSWGSFLFASLIVALLAILANVFFFQMPALHLAITVGLLLIFSLLIAYDINRVDGRRNELRCGDHGCLFGYLQGFYALIGVIDDLCRQARLIFKNSTVNACFFIKKIKVYRGKKG